MDCGIAGQNMVLAAHSMGLGTCWIAFSKLAFQGASTWKKRLGIQYPYEFAVSIAVGWPRGNPDGMVYRESHPVEWFDKGGKKVVFGDGCGPARISFLDRIRMPEYDDSTLGSSGQVSIDPVKCTGCGICVSACPADCLMLKDKKAVQRTAEENRCSLCGACMAICEKKAITPLRPLSLARHYRTIDHGELSLPRL